MNLLIISHTPHYLQDGQILGWGPTVREIDHLAALFDRVTHLAVLYGEEAPRSSLPYNARNVTLIPVKPAGGQGWRDKLEVVLAYPGYWRAIHRAVSGLKAEDVIHVRCPANLSLLALLYLTFSRRIPRRWIKYAGNWMPNKPGPLTYAWQRRLLHHNLPRGVVTINGRWPGQPHHIISFHNPSFEEIDILDGKKSALSKLISTPIQLLFAGSLDAGKGIYEAVEIAKRIVTAGMDFEFHFVGDGLERSGIEQLVKNDGLDARVFLHGWVPKPELSQYYRKAHLMILPSKSEGWPKVLSEGMAYGVVPLAGNVSSIPQILQECGTGIAFDPSDTQAFADAILSYIKDPQRWKRESEAACRSAHRFTYEAHLEHLKEVFADKWGLSL